MGGKDTPPLQYSSTNHLQSPKWESRRAETLDRRDKVVDCVPLRCQSEVNLQSSGRQQQCEAPMWHSAPASPAQEPRSSRSSTSRSEGAVSPIRQYMECIEPQSLSCALVGDSGVGKSSLLLSYTTGKMFEDQSPTVYDKFSSEFVLKLKLECRIYHVFFLSPL